jgi:hypothetical protein
VISIEDRPVKPAAVDATNGPLRAFSAAFPFEKIRHLLSDKPLHRPKKVASGTSKPGSEP